MKVQEAIFYEDDGMVSSTNPGCIQTEFDTLMVIFDRVELKTNVRKIVVMVCYPFRATGEQADESYTRWMTRAGRSYKERQCERVS